MGIGVAALWVLLCSFADGLPNLNIAELAATIRSPGSEFVHVETRDTNDPDTKVVVFVQKMDGLLVFGGRAHLLVRRQGPHFKLVFQNLRLAHRPRQGLPGARLSAEQALKKARSMDEFKDLPSWSVPTLGIYFGHAQNIQTNPVRAWTFVGESNDQIPPVRKRFYVSAWTGAVLHIEDEVYFYDITGSVTGYATPGLRPDVPTNLPVEGPVPVAQLTGLYDAVAANVLGEFLYSSPVPGPTPLSARLQSSWVTVVNTAGPNHLLNSNVTYGLPNNLRLNANRTEFNTAQLNAFIHTNYVHERIRSIAPGLTAIDDQITAYTNIHSACNAYYTEGTINFFRDYGGCVNTAYSTIIAHEYGHFVVERLGLAQGAFGEGFSDTLAHLIYDTPLIAEEFGVDYPYLRNPIEAHISYPCYDMFHTCGQTLSGIWWTLKTLYESQVPHGANALRELFGSWLLLTQGGVGHDSAHPQTAIEVLWADDDNGDIMDGTPHFELICQAFQEFHIPCPSFGFVTIEDLAPPSPAAAPHQSVPVRFRVNPLRNQSVTSVTLKYRVNQGEQHDIPLLPETNNVNIYSGDIPPRPCLDRVDYFVEVQVANGFREHYPSDYWINQISYLSATEIVTLGRYDFSEPTAMGWTSTIDLPGRPGIFERGATPDAAGGGPDGDADDSGACWATGLTGLNAGPLLAAQTTLTSPFWLTHGFDDYGLSFSYFYQSADINAENSLQISLESSAGDVFAEVATIRWNTSDWESVFYRLKALTTRSIPTQLRLRIAAHDFWGEWGVEGAIDAVRFEGYRCYQATTPTPVAAVALSLCAADLNRDGDLNDQDYALFFMWFSEGNFAADFNDDGTLDSMDVAEFLQAYAQGCY